MPDPITRVRLASTVDGHTIARQGRVAEENLHLTLLFLGNVDTARLPILKRGASGVRATPFSLQIDCSGWWKAPRILWLAPGQVPASLLLLHKALAGLAVECGIAIETRPYLPHVTLARKVDKPAAIKFAPIRWNVSDFCLVESVTRVGYVEYQIIQRWRLT